MKITNENAATLLPYVTELLRGCAFFAVDMEFTGIDPDNVEAGSNSSEEIIRAFQRHPSALYPKRVEMLKNYTMMQLGISIFTVEEREPLHRNASLSSRGKASPPDFLSWKDDVAGFLSPDTVQYERYAKVVTKVEEIFERYSTIHDQRTKASEFLANEMAVVTKSLQDFAGRGSDPEDQPKDKLPLLLHLYNFLEVLSDSVARYRGRSGIETRSSLDEMAEPVRYQVQTFTAFMFPVARYPAENVSLNIETALFLAKNNMDFTHWIQEGLRFQPISDIATKMHADVEERRLHVQEQAQPLSTFPRYRELIDSRVDRLLPLSPEEELLVKFVLNIRDIASSNEEAARVETHYKEALYQLLQFFRGDVAVSEIPPSIFTLGALYKAEMDALSAIGLTKANRKYHEIAASKKANGRRCAAGSRIGAQLHGSPLQHGDALLQAILYATEINRKPIVFYSGYTDAIFFLLSLYGADGVPKTMSAFKALIRRHFPSVFDTAVLCGAAPLQRKGNFSGRLENVVEEMSNVKDFASLVSFHFNPLLPGGEDATQSMAAHSAAFDALLTGKLFALAKKGLESMHVRVEDYGNYFGTYSTLMPINLRDEEKGVVEREKREVYFLLDSAGMRVEVIWEALTNAGIATHVMYRRAGYILQPISNVFPTRHYLEEATAVLSRRAAKRLHLFPVVAAED